MEVERTLALETRVERGMPTVVRAGIVILLLYLFLTGVELLGEGVGALGKSTQEDLFSGVTNPLAALFVGLLGTVLVQSSSVSTATIVALVAGGLISVDAAVPMIMGANLGTTVTNTLASLGHVRQDNEFRRAFAAATVHDFFNILAVAVLLPLELATGFLSNSAAWLAETLAGSGGAEFDSPLKEIVEKPAGWIAEIFEGLGLSGNALAGAMILTGLVSIFVALAFITKNMRALIADRAERAMNTVLSQGGGMIAMGVGMVITMAVQSSSITTSVMVPLAASGVLTLANIYPVTLGANVGTTITALLAALATGSIPALTVAFVHTLFNLCGILLFYPWPRLRRIPLALAEGLAEVAVTRRSAAVAYVAGMFIVMPLCVVLVLR
jgi:sodium-dependent phosphate cotransporter